jgi:adenosylmethionine-8-amino-7-oxononanoate aminotransferase
MIYDVISQPKKENPYLSHGFTYSGHPLACAVGLKNIELMEKRKLCEHVQQMGPYFEQHLFSLQNHPLVGDARGSHYMLALELVANKHTKESFPAETAIAKQVYYECKRRGLMMRPIGSLCVFSPPLTFDKTAIDTTIAIVSESLDVVYKREKMAISEL